MVEKAAAETEFEIGHVLFIDLVGYSKRLIDEQKELLNKLNRIVLETEVVRTAEAAGKLTRIPTGDGMALVFRTSPEAPARCALEISKALREEPELQLRMGIHSGPVSDVTDVNERANIAGAGINMAQRVMDFGEAGHILLSRHVAEDLEHYARWQPYLHDLGLVEVKHGVRLGIVNLYSGEVGNPKMPEKLASTLNESATPRTRRKLTATIVIIALFAAALLAVLFTRAKHRNSTFGPAAAVSDKSIAVLPFVDLSQAHDQEYFCDGISEEILDALAKVEGLRVIARTSSFSFKGKNADVSEIAQKLNVQNVLEGSLRREGNRIRITAQLVNARDGFHIWSDTFERELQGVFAVQDEITRSIVDALKIKLAVAPSARPQQNTEAYDLYLQGLYLSNKSDEENLRKSLNLFQRALDKDPTLSRAWVGIAKAWFWLADAYVKPLQAYQAVESAATKALELNENDADAHAYVSEAKRVLHWDWKTAERELQRAVEIDPNSATAHLMFTNNRVCSGDLAGGQMELDEAERLDPLSPITSDHKAMLFLYSDRLDDAVGAAKRTLTLDPNYNYVEPTLARIYREQGKLDDALALYLKAQQGTHEPNAGLAIAYARLGRITEAQRMLQQLIDKANRGYVAGEQIASVFVALDNHDEAFRWLNRAVDEHSGNPIATYRELHPLYSDSRFPLLLRRMGIDPTKVVGRQTAK
jgi:TolB-like protein/Tfp pilus assembly protein PilF